MKLDKIFWFDITKEEIHFEFLNVFVAACAFKHLFILIGAVNRKKKRMLIQFATWVFSYSGDGSRRLCFDLCGLKFRIRWFKTEPDPEFLKRLAPTS